MRTSQSLTLYEAARDFRWPPFEQLRVCELVVTYACNARCLFCYNPSESRSAGRRMDLVQAAKVLYERRRKSGCWAAYFTGGDATVHPELPRLIALARKMGYSCVSLDSNGLRLSEASYARRLVESGANEFGLSIHGAEPRTHDRLVGVPGAWRRCLRALENLQKFKVHIKINFAVTGLNYLELPRLAELMMSRYGESHLCVMFAHYRGILWDNRVPLGVSYAQARRPTLEALDVYRRRGVGIENRMLINYLPCVLPGYEDLMSDWSRRGGEQDYLDLPEGPRGGVRQMQSRRRMKAPACVECVYQDSCMGFEREYHAVYGDQEFAPLPNKPAVLLSRRGSDAPGAASC